MWLDKWKIGRKLLLPAAFSALTIICIGGVSAIELKTIASTAREIIEQRDTGILEMARASRRIFRTLAYDYAALASDNDSPMGKMAAKLYQGALKGAEANLDNAARLLPDKADQIRGFKSRLAAVEKDLDDVFVIARATPGLDHGRTLKPEELDLMAKGARMIGPAGIALQQINDDVTALNTQAIAENARIASDLQSQAQTTIIGLAVGGVLAALAAAGFAYWLSSTKVAHPLLRIAELMGRLAAGDTGVRIEGENRGDEVGTMARAVQIFQRNAIEKIRLEAEASATREAREAEKARQDALIAETARSQAQVVETIGHGLGLLSNGRLTHRIADAFPGEYESLRADFNAAMARLQETLSVVANNTGAITSGTREISTAADDLARRTEQQAASLEETAAALRHITDTVHKTAEGAGQAYKLVTQAKIQAEQSGNIVSEAISAMNAIDKSSEEMGQIIGVIDEIAFQTNLLALNAGVEAARAGEAGKGFAVVASEVRALAQRSAEAAKEIKTLITSSSGQVEQGVELVRRTGEALQLIVHSIGEITHIVSEISTGAREQSTELAEINAAVNQMDKTTQQNAAMVEESTAASHELARETAELSKIIEVFDIGVGHTARAARVATNARAAKAKERPVATRKVANGHPVVDKQNESWQDF